MEDIEDLVVGTGAPPGFRLPLTAVGVNLKKKKSNKLSQTSPSPEIPGTQVSLSSLAFSLCSVFL
jgi:threonylcarbamoyladenosine tRNA methylthiotransferase CDKAL1